MMLKKITILCIFPILVLSTDTPYMREQLNAMQDYFDQQNGYTGPSSKFDTYYYDQIEECFEMFDDDILAES